MLPAVAPGRDRHRMPRATTRVRARCSRALDDRADGDLRRRRARLSGGARRLLPHADRGARGAETPTAMRLRSGWSRGRTAARCRADGAVRADAAALGADAGEELRARACAASSPMSAERRPRVLVTRPAADAAPLAERWRGLGFEPVTEPLLTIVPTDAAIDLDGVQAGLLTSANGARALARATRRRDRRCSRSATPPRARRGRPASRGPSAPAAMSAISPGGGGALPPPAGRAAACLRPRGAGDLAGLSSAGSRCAAPCSIAPSLPPRCRAGFGARRRRHRRRAVFVSPHRAQLCYPVEAAGLAPAAGRLRLLALSPRVAQAASAIAFAAVAVAARPDQDALLDLLADVPGTGQ